MRRSPSGRLALAGAVSLLLGGATSYLQAVLPHLLAPLANSAGSWCLVAFLLALLVVPARRVGLGAVAAGTALAGLVAGYYVVAHLRGFGVNPSTVAFWCVAAVTVGPVLGAAAVVVRDGVGWRHLVASLVLPGLLVAEGVRGLLVLRGSTSATYWSAQIVVGLAILGCSLRAKRCRGRNT